MSAHRLLVMRHAKSSWSDPDVEDHDRPLNGRGRAAATRVGEYLREQDLAPDLVLCSSAERARQTLELLVLGESVETLIEPGLYGAAVGELMSRVRRVADTSSSVMVIGHNPGMHELAVGLVGDSSGLEAFPTAALADLSCEIASWADLRPGIASLRRFIVPREL